MESRESGSDRPPARRAGLGDLAADLAGMVRFFSRLPVPRVSAADDPAAVPDFARAVRLLPLAALVVAAPAAAVVALAGRTALPGLAVAGLALSALLLATGALHEDGLADTADGFGGGATRERKLEIMRDSRIGSYGAAALALSLLVRAALVAGLLAAAGPDGAALAVLAAAAVSRALALAPMALLPPARATGLAAAAGRLPRSSLFAALALAAALTGLLLGWTRPAAALAGALALAAAGTGALALIARRQIGGQTGDVVGATQQVAEILFLAGLAATAP